ncbi:MAG: ABC transporter permease [Nitrospinota bacterium]|nr:MAG: ABC transporter permease [Nitrospinota bacterium]
MVRRIFAIFLRQFYLYRRSIHRVLGLFYWPTLELFLWGFLTVYLNRIGAANFDFVPLLLGGLIFWNLFNRAQQSVSISFLEDVWTRNLGNIFASPIRPLEFLGGLIMLSVFQSAISFTLMAGLATILWKFDLFRFGLLLLPFFANLFLLGWTFGILSTALVLRLGPSVDILAWSFPVLIQPLSAVFYPMSVLPGFLQPIAWLLPTAHVFEGMRAVLLQQVFSPQRLLWALGLNLCYFTSALLFFQRSFRHVRQKGLLQRYTE